MARIIIVTGAMTLFAAAVLFTQPTESRDARREDQLCRASNGSVDGVGAVPSTQANAQRQPRTAVEPGHRTDADYERHVSQLRRRLPDKFHVVVEEPFVVIGDEALATVRRRARDTVKFAVDRLKRDFFARDPDEIIDVWLFKDDASYRQYTRELFNDRPTTPFGYYSPRRRALIMNIATGGGTLVHEIVHPFMHANFPECPPWFNEGLGSLYEQCADRDGHLHGLTNWRLEGLHDAIRAGDVPTFEALTAQDEDAFYNRDRGTNYGQSRYLCYYLQERGLLVKFYHEFVKNQKDDPTGFKTLRRVLGEPDMIAFQRKWDAFVMTLTFP